MPGSSSKTVASALIGGASVSGALLAYAALIEPYAIQHVKVTLWSERLPTSFDGYIVLLLSDFHSRGIERRERLVLDMVGALPTPDLIALDGDFIYTPRGMEAFASEFGGALRARDGVFAVFGNSEHKNGVVPHQFARHLEANGVTVLLNRNTRVQRGGETIAIAGVDDPASFHDDVASAVDGIPGTEFQIMLMHSPDSIGVACSLGVDLVLSGHTHGGQVEAADCRRAIHAFQTWARDEPWPVHRQKAGARHRWRSWTHSAVCHAGNRHQRPCLAFSLPS